jgi:hypothetical protein
VKFLKAFLGVILLIVAVLLLIGVFIPEVDEQFETRVDRSVVAVYAGMLNPNDLPKWIKGLDEVKQTGGVLAMPGSTFDLFYRSKETDVVYKLQILEMMPLQSVKLKMYNEMMELEVSIKFEADGPATNITTYIQAKGSSIVGRSFLPLLKSVLMEEAKQNLDNFKQLQEQPS